MVGISSALPSDGNSLLYTLISLFQAVSKTEQKDLRVLVHLAYSERSKLRDAIIQISGFFGPQILAGQLLLLHTPATSSSGAHKTEMDQETYARQNMDYAFLVTVATGLSDYFLLLDDHATCAPSFVTHLHWKVRSLQSQSWVFLEFSNLGFLGKLFRSHDLPRLAHFLLLFNKDKPLDQLLLHFQTLQARRPPVICTPFLFYRQGSSPDSALLQRGSLELKKPPVRIVTDMKALYAHFSWEVYTSGVFFWTYNVSARNHLTIILNQPANLTRVQVLTGTVLEGKHILEKGQVELGRSPQGTPPRCTRFSLLGHLKAGQMEVQRLLGRQGLDVSCVRLVVKAPQLGELLIRHINLQEEPANSERASEPQKGSKSFHN